jgi:hypothetical protein
MRFRGVLAFFLCAGVAAAAAAQTKISGQLQCGKPDEVHSIDVGDRANHAMSVSKVSCTWSKPMDIGGSATKEGASVATSERSGNKSWERGSHAGTTADGDKYFVRYQGSATLKDGKPESITGTWTFVGGTGKHKTLKGKGTYKSATMDADGNITFDVEGEYTQ